MRVTRAADGVCGISLAWSNTYVLTDGKSATVIDVGLRQDRDALLAGLLEIGLSPASVTNVLLTHGHCDHAGNAAYLHTLNPALRVWAHRCEWPYLQPPLRTYPPHGLAIAVRPLAALAFRIGERRFPVERLEIDGVLEDGDMIETPAGTLQAVFSPGHSPGHTAFWRAEDRALFSGDAILNIVPFRRTAALSLPIRMLSSDWAQAKRSARQLAKLDADLLLAGHGWPLHDDTAARIRQWSHAL